MDPLLLIILIMAVIYGIVQVGWAICICFLMGVVYIYGIIRNVSEALLLYVQKQRIIKLIKIRDRQVKSKEVGV